MKMSADIPFLLLTLTDFLTDMYHVYNVSAAVVNILKWLIQTSQTLKNVTTYFMQFRADRVKKNLKHYSMYKIKNEGV
jgi:hypothetical protein